MPKLSLSGDSKNSFIPGDIVRFNLKADVFGERVSPIIQFTVPGIPPRIDKSIVTYRTAGINVSYTLQQMSVVQYRCKKLSDATRTRAQRNTLTLIFSDFVNPANDLISARTRIKLSTTNIFPVLNNQTFTITDKTNSDTEKSISLTVTNTQVPVTGITTLGVAQTIAVLDGTGNSKSGKRYTVSVGQDYQKYLMYNDYVRDYIVFYYQPSGGLPKLMSTSNPLPIDYDFPPLNTVVNSNFTFGTTNKRPVQSKSIDLSDTDAERVRFFVGVARYIYDQERSFWDGFWLHKDENGKAIIAEASPA